MREPGPGDVLGGYRLGELLGEGGMGRVYRAQRVVDGWPVALKVLRGELAADEEHTRRFRREASAATAVRHPHLVPLVEAGEQEGHRFLAMQLISGMTLAARLEVEGALPVADVVRIVSEVASGLDALHDAGLVHRDVKPSNVLLDETGRAMLTDFGLVRGGNLSIVTTAGQLLGTVDYLAPEIFRGGEPGPAADVYALGCVVFECLAGRPPFTGRSAIEVGFAHLQDPPPNPCVERPEAPAAVGEAVRSAMAKEPDSRPPSPSAFARLLEAVAAGG